ncbi:MAG: hypothetical protein KBB39_10850 [Phycicoccus sp.]|nr:hypothetical protein [Phycicoccus sp.]
MRSMRNAVGVVATLLAVSGCGGIFAPPAAPPSVSVTPSPSYSVPEAAAAHSPKGAAAFVRFYYTQLNAAYTQPSGVLLGPLGADSCEACTAYEELAASLVQQGQRVDTDPVEVVSLNVTSASTAETVVAEVQMRQAAANVVDATGAILNTQEAKEYQAVLEVVWQGDRWLLGSVN